jgi:hypothetical protein
VPVVLPAATILVALAMLALALVATIIIVSLLERIEFEVPHVGTIRIPGIDRIARAVERAWRDWLQPHIDTLTGWLDNVATHLREFPREVADAFTGLAKQLEHYTSVVVHKVIQAFLTPVRIVAHRADAVAAAAATGLVDLRGDARGWVNGLRDFMAGELVDLRGYVLGRLGDVHEALSASITAVRRMVVEGVYPRLADIELELPSIRAALDRIDAWLSDVRAWFLPIAAVFSGAAALALLRHVHECRARSDRLCATDPDFLDELLGLAFLVVSISELQAFVRTAAPVAGGLADEFLDRS